MQLVEAGHLQADGGKLADVFDRGVLGVADHYAEGAATLL